MVALEQSPPWRPGAWATASDSVEAISSWRSMAIPCGT